MNKQMKPDLMNFTETYNLRAVKYLYSMSNENLIEILGAYKKEETFDDYSMVEKEAYVNTIKKHLTKLIKDDNPSVSKKYNYSKGRALGRIYANEFGIQKLAKPFRELLWDLLPDGFAMGGMSRARDLGHSELGIDRGREAWAA